jgi:phospholipase/lecithinase/hemolysin
MTAFSTLYAFGDSLSDAGNAWLLTESPYAAGLGLSAEPVSPPYYQEIYNTVTADVFSNGPVWTQDLSATLGLGTLAPSGVGAYANTILSVLAAQYGASEAAILLTLIEASAHVTGADPYIPLVAGASGGTDFAVGGAVTGPTGENGAVTGLDGLTAQLQTFQYDVATPDPNALVTLSIGGNDVLNVLEDANFATLYGAGTTLATVAATAAGQDIAQSVSIEVGFLGSLVALGLNHVVVMNVPDIGATPEATSLGAATSAAGTVLAEYYNSLLSTDIANLNTGGANIVIDNAFSLIDSAISDPASYGLQNVTIPVYSGPATSFTSADLVSTDPTVQNTYLFFDKLHPTETGEAALASLAQMALTACFATGSRVLTTDGEMPVETLRAGMWAVLADGEAAPITWVGHRDVACVDAPSPGATWPIRVAAGAFGTGRPVHDLYLSPDHAVLVDGILVPIRHLIDGGMIAPEPRDHVTWWHVALNRHDVLLVDGLPCESFLDTGERDGHQWRFSGRIRDVSLVREAEACREIVVAGPRLAKARAQVFRLGQEWSRLRVA